MSYINTEERPIWYANAEEWEKDFVSKYGERLDLIINPSKQKYNSAPDLYILKNSSSADLKVLREPFYTSQQIFNIPPQHCWTFNPSDLFEYSINYPDSFGIFIWKQFKNSFQYSQQITEDEAVYYAPLHQLKKLIKENKKIHQYVRRMNDTNGNSFGSFGIDLRRIYRFEL